MQPGGHVGGGRVHLGTLGRIQVGTLGRVQLGTLGRVQPGTLGRVRLQTLGADMSGAAVGEDNISVGESWMAEGFL